MHAFLLLQRYPLLSLSAEPVADVRVWLTRWTGPVKCGGVACGTFHHPIVASTFLAVQVRQTAKLSHRDSTGCSTAGQFRKNFRHPQTQQHRCAKAAFRRSSPSSLLIGGRLIVGFRFLEGQRESVPRPVLMLNFTGRGGSFARFFVQSSRASELAIPFYTGEDNGRRLVSSY